MTKQVQAQAGKYLTFVLHDQTFGIPIQSIREINRVSEITSVPQTAKYMVGIINLRGKVIPVMDLRIRFDLEAKPYDKETCIVVIDTDRGRVGAIVNSVREVAELTKEQIEAAPGLGQDDWASRAINGIGKAGDHVILLVDVTMLTQADLAVQQPKEEAQDDLKIAA